MSGLSVNTGAMDANGRQTVANAEEFANELASLRSNIDGLMSSSKFKCFSTIIS